MERFLYHFKPQRMTGDTLIPLNALFNSHPEIYAQHLKKYKGREDVLKEKIPIIDCLWNDVLHISPINPQIILDLWRHEGLYSHARVPAKVEVYQIPVELIDEATTVCFQSYNFDFKNYDPNLDKYWAFKKDDFVEQKQVQIKQLEVWKNDFETGRTFFWYSHTMHILARQRIDTKKCRLLVCQ